jgi:hypothetical protein
MFGARESCKKEKSRKGVYTYLEARISGLSQKDEK